MPERKPAVGEQVIFFDDDGDIYTLDIAEIEGGPNDEGMYTVMCEEDTPSVVYWSDEEGMWVDKESEQALEENEE